MVNQGQVDLTLTQAREMAAGSIDSVKQLGELVFALVHGTEVNSIEFASITWKPSGHQPKGGAHRDAPKLPGCWTWHDMHGGCAVYCDPPGTCSPCDSGGGVAAKPIFLEA